MAKGGKKPPLSSNPPANLPTTKPTPKPSTPPPSTNPRPGAGGLVRTAGGTVLFAGLGTGAAALAGLLPGTQGFPGAIGDFLNNATGGLLNIGSTAMYAAGAVALILLLK